VLQAASVLTKINILNTTTMQLYPKARVIGLNLKQFINMKKSLVFLCGGLLLAGVAFAQEKTEQKKEKIKVKVEKNINGKKEVFEKEIDASGMSEEEKNDIIDHLQDSLGVRHGKGGKVKIMIDENSEELDNEDFTFEHKPRVRVYKRGGNFDSNSFSNDFEFDIDKFSERMKDVYADLPRRIEQLPQIHRWDDHLFSAVDGAPIRSLDVFPNRPDVETLNVRFYALKEGDVNITVVDLKGNVVSKSEIKAFKGEYVGQIKLKKADPGVYFVIVAQGDDGISKRVSI
jgi:hypothetical protein